MRTLTTKTTTTAQHVTDNAVYDVDYTKENGVLVGVDCKANRKLAADNDTHTEYVGLLRMQYSKVGTSDFLLSDKLETYLAEFRGIINLIEAGGDAHVGE